MLEIDTTSVHYFSVRDETNFYDWLKEIKCLESFKRGIAVVDPDKADHSQLLELIAALYRYNVPMHPLRDLKNSRNEEWFADPIRYWHDAVFG